jgi:hypothetical protein
MKTASIKGEHLSKDSFLSLINLDFVAKILQGVKVRFVRTFPEYYSCIPQLPRDVYILSWAIPNNTEN